MNARKQRALQLSTTIVSGQHTVDERGTNILEVKPLQSIGVGLLDSEYISKV